MSIIHIACCPVQLDKPNLRIGPEGTLNGRLTNKYDYTWAYVRGQDVGDDPRRIIEIDWDDAQTAQEKTDFKAILLGALGFCSAAEKTIGEAETIIEEVSGEAYTQTGGKLVWDDDPFGA